MSTRTQYILQGIFFLFLGAALLYLAFSGFSAANKKVTLLGAGICLFVAFLYFKNALKEGRR